MIAPAVAVPSGLRVRSAWLLGVGGTLICLFLSWRPSFWLDEAASLSAARRPLPDLFELLGRLDAVHGTYYSLLHGWIAVAGDSEFAARLPSAVGVGCAVAGTYVLAVECFGRQSIAVTAALVAAVLPRVTWMGVEARSFAIATALAVWATVVFVRASRGSTVGPWIAYALLAGVGTMVHLYVCLAVVAHAASSPWTLRSSRARWSFLAAAGAAAVLSAPIVLLGLSQRGQLTQTGGFGPVALARRVVVNQWFLGETPGPVDAGPWQTSAVSLAVIGWSLAIFGAVRLLAGDSPARHRAVGPVLLTWLVVPTALVAVQALLGGSLYHPRYFGFCAPAIAVLIAVGINELRDRRWRWSAIVLAVLLILPVYFSQRITYAKSGYDWSVVASRLQQQAQPGDGVYFSPLALPEGSEVTTTTRSIASAYPRAFAPLIDITVRESGEQRLFAPSEPLAAVDDRLRDVDVVWVVRRSAAPPALKFEDDAVFSGAGFSPTSTWVGPITTLVRWERG